MSDSIPLLNTYGHDGATSLCSPPSRSADGSVFDTRFGSNSLDSPVHEDQPLLDSPVVSDTQQMYCSTESEMPRNSSARSSMTPNSEVITNLLGNSTISPQSSNIWGALKSVRIKTLLYSVVVTVTITMLAFGYDMGVSSPTLHDLDQNNGRYTYFNRAIYHDLFNVSGNNCLVAYFIINRCMVQANPQFCS